MSELKVDLSRELHGMKIAVDWLNEPFEEMIKNLGPIQTKALNTAAFIIKDKIKETFVTKMPAAGRPFKVPATSKNGYKIDKPDMLVEAVRQASASDIHTKVYVGKGDSGSPLFIARMYNKGSRDRYQKTYRGQKLKKPRYLGRITGVDYWDPGIIAGQQEATDAVERILEKYTEEYINHEK